MQVEPIPNRPRRTAAKTPGRQLSSMDRPFDFPDTVPLRKSYIIASTPRCGATFLSTRLWATGVLGAPAEYFGFHKHVGTKMMERLKASSPADYLDRLLACRTSKNGIFGMNAEFNDFEEALRRFPEMLSVLSPVTYILVERADQAVQAAFMAKSVQIDAQPAAQRKQQAALRYDRDLISKWLGRIERQRLGWTRWFESNGIVPFVVDYEKLTGQPAAVVSSIVELIGVRGDKPQTVRVTLAEKPSDQISQQWAARFEREIRNGIELRDVGAGATDKTVRAAKPAKPKTSPAKGDPAPHIFDRYDAIEGTVLRPPVAKRLRHRYEVVVARNRALLKNARVLDLRSGDGRWSYAAIEAGAAEVVGIDSKHTAVEAAGKAFRKIGVKPTSYRFINAKLFAALRDFSPNTFDIVLCRDVSADPHFFFKCLWRLRPKHVILDTRIDGRKEPTAIFKLNKPDKAGAKGQKQSGSLVAIPSEALLKGLCECFGFRCRAIDERDVPDEAGDRDGARRRIYMLDRIVAQPDRVS
jgi:LPS sulfotransferase NodH/predicted nicotinamide N-methyase